MAAPAATAPAKFTALVAGGSGLVGGRVLELLCAHPEVARVVAISRRPLSIDHPKLANRIVRFEALETTLDGLRADVALCCLGTTLRTAGSPEAFRVVDHDHVLAFARAARKAGAERFVLNSSVGADAGSRNLYLRVKGEAEAHVIDVGFAALDIVQPSLLLGLRREIRPLELAAMALAPLGALVLQGGAQRYRAIGVGTVAAAMVSLARGSRKGVTRYTYRQLRELASPKRRSRA